MTAPVERAIALPEREIVVNVADFAVARGGGVIATCGLGSCVAIMLFDDAAEVAALAHVLLPEADPKRALTNPAKYASTAVPLLVEEARRLGARTGMRAKLVGGARMFGALLTSGVNMGERNVEAARRALAAARVPVVAEDVGGEFGRSVYIDVVTGQVRVRSLEGQARVL